MRSDEEHEFERRTRLRSGDRRSGESAINSRLHFCGVRRLPSLACRLVLGALTPRVRTASDYSESSAPFGGFSPVTARAGARRYRGLGARYCSAFLAPFHAEVEGVSVVVVPAAVHMDRGEALGGPRRRLAAVPVEILLATSLGIHPKPFDF